MADPHFLLPPLLSKHVTKDLTPEEQQYGVLSWNLKRGPDVGDVLVHRTTNNLPVWFKVDKRTMRCMWNRALDSY